MTLGNVQHRLLKQRRFKQVLFFSLFVAIFMGLLIVPIEASHPQATIKNSSDGLWWSLQTLTTVGYGDTTPVTGLGRVLGLVMQLVGTVMFAILLAMIGTTMSRSQEEFYWDRLFDRINRMEEKNDQMAKIIEFLVKNGTKIS